jgi:hypothetical protein
MQHLKSSVNKSSLRSRVFESEHLDLRTSISNLAGVLDRQGKYEAEEQLDGSMAREVD